MSMRMRNALGLLAALSISGILACPAEADLPAAPLVEVVSGETTPVDLRLYLPNLTPPIRSAFLGKAGGPSLKKTLWRADLRDIPIQLWVGVPESALLNLTVEDHDRKKAVLPVHVTQRPLHIYIYRPEGASRPKEVLLAGSFNGWNGAGSPLTDPDGDGTFTRKERHPPGRHLYKLVVDGNWIPDPSNPNRTQDGFNNSILDLGLAGPTPPALVPWAQEAPPLRDMERLRQYGVVFRVVGEGMLDTNNILVFLNGQPVKDGHVSYRHPYLTVQAAFGYRTLRIEALSGGRRLVPVFIDNRKGTARDDILYFAMTDRFYDGDEKNNQPVGEADLAGNADYNGGDFIGITQKIEEGYFDRLGVTMLWISPPNDQPDVSIRDSLPPHKKFTGYHGYWPVHHERTESRFGTIGELKRLVESAHGHGIRVIFDFVANHVHQDHPFFQEHHDWFGPLTLPDGIKNIRKWEHPYTTWFDEFLPDIDYDKAEPLRAMAANARWWLDQTGADGFRLDAVKHVPLRFWLRLRNAMGDTPVYFVGETIDSRKTIMQFVGPGALDGQFDFPLYWAIRDVFAAGRGGFADIERAVADGEREYDPTAVHSTLLGNHDMGRFMCFADGDPEVGGPVAVDKLESYEKLKLAFAFLLTQPGVPTIYYGDEIGMTGGKDPDNRRMMRFDESAAPAEQSAPDHPWSFGRDVLERVSTLTHLRRIHPCLSRGARRAIHVSEDAYAYLRAYFDDRLLVVFNRSADTRSLDLAVGPELAAGELKGLLSGRPAQVDASGIARVEIPPMSAEIWAQKK